MTLSSPSKSRRGSSQTIRHMKAKSGFPSFVFGICFGAFALVGVLNCMADNNQSTISDELIRTSRKIQEDALPIIDSKITPVVESISQSVKTATEYVVTKTSPDTRKPQYKKMMVPIAPRSAVPPKDLVKSGDYIYFDGERSWDDTPVVVESHRLIFFTVPKAGCTVWKQLFRRMMGYEDWQLQDGERMIPHDPKHNGLKYLSDYSLKDASRMMTSPEWTRAIMVRDPKSRFLSAFLDKSLSNDHRHIIDVCCPDESCVADAQTLDGFLELCKRCNDSHWLPQHKRIDYKFWPYMDLVLHTENSAHDAKKLLERIGAWEEFGASGWGSDGKRAILENKETSGAGEHATYSQWKVWEWYTPGVEEKVEAFFRADYENPMLGFESGKCLTCTGDDAA